MIPWTSWACTDPGTVRTGNEDAYVERPDAFLWAVADGAGGHQHGEVASGELKRSLDAMPVLAGADLLAEIRSRVAAVHDGLRERADSEADVSGMAVTIASTLVVFLAHEAHYACLWCGDSRAYLLRAGVLSQLTSDHSLVQEMVDAGVLAAADAEQHPHANVLTRAIGAGGPAPELDKLSGRAEPGDRFLLCSDGVFKVLQLADIAGLIAGADPARTLIAAAVGAEARDNVTAVVIEHATRPSPDDDTLMIRPVDASMGGYATDV